LGFGAALAFGAALGFDLVAAFGWALGVAFVADFGAALVADFGFALAADFGAAFARALPAAFGFALVLVAVAVAVAPRDRSPRSLRKRFGRVAGRLPSTPASSLLFSLIRFASLRFTSPDCGGNELESVKPHAERGVESLRRTLSMDA
jgi:hypothetical protein